MTIEHMPDGSKQFTDAQGVVTKHADMSAVMHYQSTGQRLAYDQPQGQQSGQLEPQSQPQGQDGRNAVDDYLDRCRNVGVARARRSAGIE